VSLPIVVVLALLFGHVIGAPGSTQNSPAASGSAQPSALPPLSPSAPPSSAAASKACTKVLQRLPVELGELQPRVVHPQPASPFVVAWGDPPVVLSCGVHRPSELKAHSNAPLTGVDGVFWLVHRNDSATNWISVDRAVYIEVSVPKAYRQPPIAPLADAISKALPQVCLPQAAPGQSPPPTNKLCTRRK
jgi:hypothetical protein